MKAAIFIEDGVQQVVLTPENEWERTSLRAIEGKRKKVETHWGTFYTCRGGWLRQSHDFYSSDNSESSLIFRISDKPVEPPVQMHPQIGDVTA